MNFKKILVLSPHTDDGELACGGTIAKFVREGHSVNYVGFAYPKGVPESTLNEELLHALDILKVRHHTVLGFKTRYFPESRQEILDEMIRLGDEIKPDLVLLPSRFDQHQDHQVICQEGFRAFKHCSILGYEQPWNNVTFRTDTFIELSDGDLARKLEAIRCYKSQEGRSFFEQEFLYSLAKTRGIQVGVPFAEAFETIRWII